MKYTGMAGALTTVTPTHSLEVAGGHCMTRILNFFNRAAGQLRASLRRIPWGALATSLLAEIVVSSVSSLVIAAL